MTIALPSGSVRHPLVKVPSDHLALVVDEYGHTRNKKGGLPEPELNLLAEPAQTEQPATSSDDPNGSSEIISNPKDTPESA